MVDISSLPFFSYNKIIDRLIAPLSNLAPMQFLGFSRMYPTRKRFLICYHKEWAIDFYSIQKLYRFGLYERDICKLPSAFNMWDHLSYSPPQIYEYNRERFGIAHGLTIVKQFGDYCDTFVFSPLNGNGQINNFYLNQKDLFNQYVNNFYIHLSQELKDLDKYKFIVPEQKKIPLELNNLTDRQRECAKLLTQGATTKEIAYILKISHRTVEDHITRLKSKVNAKNRPQLLYLLNKHLIFSKIMNAL